MAAQSRARAMPRAGDAASMTAMRGTRRHLNGQRANQGALPRQMLPHQLRPRWNRYLARMQRPRPAHPQPTEGPRAPCRASGPQQSHLASTSIIIITGGVGSRLEGCRFRVIDAMDHRWILILSRSACDLQGEAVAVSVCYIRVRTHALSSGPGTHRGGAGIHVNSQRLSARCPVNSTRAS